MIRSSLPLLQDILSSFWLLVNQLLPLILFLEYLLEFLHTESLCAGELPRCYQSSLLSSAQCILVESSRDITGMLFGTTSLMIQSMILNGLSISSNGYGLLFDSGAQCLLSLFQGLGGNCIGKSTNCGN